MTKVTINHETPVSVTITPQPAHQIQIRLPGVQGIQGIPGQGEKGDKGDKGEPGNDGAPGLIQSIVPGDNVTVDDTDPANPVVSAAGGGGGQVDGIDGGDGIDVDSTDPENPIVALDASSQASLALADSSVQPSDLAAVATSGDYEDLTGAPTLGNSSSRNVGTTAGTVAAGDDSRFTAAPTALQSVVEGDGISIDDTDPLNPIISALGGGGGSVAVTYEVVTTSGTFTKAADDIAYFIECIGGGGGGSARAAATGQPSMGGSGGESVGPVFLTETQVSSTESMVIGAGAARVVSGTNSSSDGNPGGDTSFGSLVVGRGGRPGTLVGNFNAGLPYPYPGPNATYAAVQTMYFERGGPSIAGTLVANTTRGGGGGGNVTGSSPSLVAQPGGGSQFGGGGGAANLNGSPNDGTAPGGGGGSSTREGTASIQGGAGARGEIRIWRLKQS